MYKLDRYTCISIYLSQFNFLRWRQRELGNRVGVLCMLMELSYLWCDKVEIIQREIRCNKICI